jgi:hypothetical protein
MAADMTLMDWRHPPVAGEALPLWAAVHDADLVAVATSLLDRTVTLELHVEHLHLECGLLLAGVTSLRISTFLPWPGTANVRPDTPRDIQEKAVAVFKAKGREQSISLFDLQEALTTGELSLLDGDMISGEGGTAIALEGMGGKADDWFRIIVAAESVVVKRSDGVEISVSEFVRLGQEYWDSQ